MVSQSNQSPAKTSVLGPIDRLVAVRRLDDGSSAAIQQYESVEKPFPLGNTSGIAYGGFCISLAIASAYQSLLKSQLSALNIYSVQATFLGPTRLDSSVQLEVSILRETSSFSTRLVIVKQDQGWRDEKSVFSDFRSTLAIIIDFVITKGDRTPIGMVYADQPACTVTDHTKLPTVFERMSREVQAGRLDEGTMKAVVNITKDITDLCEQKFTPEALLWDNLGGLLTRQPTKQDHKKMTEKVSFDWFKYLREKVPAREIEVGTLFPPTERASSACFYGLVLDSYLSFLPLVFSHGGLYDVEACSSLDLSLRFHVDDLRGDLWNLREMKTIAGEDERTYSQARLWQKAVDRSTIGQDQFKLIATMTQSSIMRSFAKEGSHL